MYILLFILSCFKIMLILYFLNWYVEVLLTLRFDKNKNLFSARSHQYANCKVGTTAVKQHMNETYRSHYIICD